MSAFTLLASEYVADTMAVVLHLENRKSSINVKQIFDAGNTIIHIPAIVFAEILYLSEKQRISLTLVDVRKHLQHFSSYRELPLNLEIIEQATKINDIPELHDRLIVASAQFLELELVTNDPKIQSSASGKTVW
jgi:PIN domain nuclease of toxin-antitoxin system